jgi:hypothetical protein
MDRRSKIILLIAVGVIMIVAILVFFFWPGAGATPAANVNANANANANAPAQTAPANVNLNAPSAPRPANESEKAAAGPKTIAVSFAERLDSYSSQSGLTNLDALKPITADDTWQFINTDYRARLKKTFPPDNAYLGVSTKVVSAEQVSFDGTAADYVLKLQEVWSGTATGAKYPTLEVKLAKVGDNWIVNFFKWEQ